MQLGILYRLELNSYVDYATRHGIMLGIDMGEERGMLMSSIQTAKRMRQAGMSDADIHAFTQLPLDDLKNLEHLQDEILSVDEVIELKEIQDFVYSMMK